MKAPVEQLWASYRDEGLPKLGPLSEHEVKRHHESFFAGATALAALLSAPLQPDAPRFDEQVVGRYIGDIFKELEDHKRTAVTS